MKPTNIYFVLLFTQVLGSLIYSLLVLDPFFSNNSFLWIPVYWILSILISAHYLLPFYGLIWLFGSVKKLNNFIPYDGWMIQAFGCIVYFLLIFFWADEVENKIHWMLGYYPVGACFFGWYHWLKLKGKTKV